MKVKKNKFIKRTINFFKINFGFFEPFNILIDGNFLHLCLEKKIDFKTKLEKLMKGASLINHILFTLIFIYMIFFLSFYHHFYKIQYIWQSKLLTKYFYTFLYISFFFLLSPYPLFNAEYKNCK